MRRPPEICGGTRHRQLSSQNLEDPAQAGFSVLATVLPGGLQFWSTGNLRKGCSDNCAQASHFECPTPRKPKERQNLFDVSMLYPLLPTAEPRSRPKSLSDNPARRTSGPVSAVTTPRLTKACKIDLGGAILA